MESVRRRIPLYRFGVIEYRRGKGAVSGSFEFGASTDSAKGAQQRQERSRLSPAAAAPRGEHDHHQANARR